MTLLIFLLNTALLSKYCIFVVLFHATANVDKPCAFDKQLSLQNQLCLMPNFFLFEVVSMDTLLQVFEQVYPF